MGQKLTLFGGPLYCQFAIHDSCAHNCCPTLIFIRCISPKISLSCCTIALSLKDSCHEERDCNSVVENDRKLPRGGERNKNPRTHSLNVFFFLKNNLIVFTCKWFFFKTVMCLPLKIPLPSTFLHVLIMTPSQRYSRIILYLIYRKVFLISKAKDKLAYKFDEKYTSGIFLLISLIFLLNW